MTFRTAQRETSFDFEPVYYFTEMALSYLEKVLRHAEKKLLAEAQRKPKDSLNLYRNFLKIEDHRLKLAHGRGEGGRSLCRSRADLISVVLRHVWQAALENVQTPQNQGQAGQLALVAVGGFGRGELNPYSDVDILFLYARGPESENHAVEEVIEQVLYVLWDVGFKVGHASRTLEEVVEQANADLQTKTSLLEARLVCGDPELWAQFERSFERLCITGRENEYAVWRMQDQSERHQKHGSTVFVQEPHVKQGCGGLRDYQNLLWLARVKKGLRSTMELQEAKLLHTRERHQIEQAHDFLLRLRTEMHILQDRGNDQLTLQLQGRVANSFHYPQANILRRTEALMRNYYRHAQDMFLITNAVARRLAGQAGALKPRWSFLPSQSTDGRKVDGFTLQDGEIEISDPTLLTEDPLRLVRVFLLAQQSGTDIGPHLAMRLRRRLPVFTRAFIYRKEVREVLLAILAKKGCVGRILRRMHELQLLGRVFPEFAPLTCLVQHEFFHRYTADEHTLVCLEMLDKIIDATRPPFNKYRPLFHKIEKAHVLYLAMLLHDTGKSDNGKHHSEEGAVNAVKVARRLKLPSDELATLVFLVDHHLSMSETARRKNLEDEETILQFARLVQTQERLDLLMLLTFADNEGTSGSQSWSDWKELLLWQLYRRTEAALTGSQEFTLVLQRSLEAQRERLVTKLHKEIDEEEITAHFTNLPTRYFQNIPEPLIIEQIRLVHEFFRHQVMHGETALKPVVRWRDFPQQGHSEVMLVTWDRERVFAKIAGAFAAIGLSILNADVYTRSDNIVIDTFRVCSMQPGGLMDERDKEIFQNMIDRSFTELVFDVSAFFKHQTLKVKPLFEEVSFPTKISFDLRSSSEYTLLDVQAPDRPGLLHILANVLADLGLDVGFARITTEKGAALDTFYLTDREGQKITGHDRLERVMQKLQAALQS